MNNLIDHFFNQNVESFSQAVAQWVGCATKLAINNKKGIMLDLAVDNLFYLINFFLRIPLYLVLKH